MRRIFCFSRNWRPNSETFGLFLVFAFCPGAAVRRSTAHFFDRQRSPLRKSFTFSPGFPPLALSRRHMRQTGPVYRAIFSSPGLKPRHYIFRASLGTLHPNFVRVATLDAAALRRAAAVMRDRRHVLDDRDLQARGLQR